MPRLSVFGLRHSFVIRHSDFVIPPLVAGASVAYPFDYDYDNDDEYEAERQ